MAARSVQPTIPLAGLVPATHVFECGSIDGREGVDGRDKPGQGEPKVVPVSSAPLCSCSKKPNRTAVAVIRIGNSWAPLGTGSSLDWSRGSASFWLCRAGDYRPFIAPMGDSADPALAIAPRYYRRPRGHEAPRVIRSCRSASTPIASRLTCFLAGSAVGKLLDGRPFRR